MKRLIETGIILMFFGYPLNAQDVPFGKEWMDDLEEEEGEILESQDTYGEERNDYLSFKPGINSATREDFMLTGWLTIFQIEAILAYRRQYGDIMSWYELMYTEAFNQSEIQRLSLGFSLGHEENGLNAPLLNRRSRQQLWVRYQQVPERSRAYLQQPKTYPGPPYRSLIRWRSVEGSHQSIGITMERDAGEPRIQHKNAPWVDFFSFHFFHRHLRPRLLTLAIGDYHVRLGQGFMLYTGFGFRKTPAATPIHKITRRLAPYTSSDEFRFLRGVAIEWRWSKRWQSLQFVSYKPITTRIDTLEDGQVVIRSIQTNGLHRTENERMRRHHETLIQIGHRLSHHHHRMILGWNVLYTEFSLPWIPEPALYRTHQFSGKRNVQAGMDYYAAIRRSVWSGEWIWLSTGGTAMVHQVSVKVSERLEWACHLRMFHQYGFHFMNLPFAESSRPISEQGWYQGILWNLARKWTLSAYTDAFRFMGSRYLIDRSTVGGDFLSELTWNRTRQHKMYLRFRFRNQTLGGGINDWNTQLLQSRHTYRVRWHQSWPFHPNWGMDARIEWTWLRQPQTKDEQGALVYQEAYYLSNNQKWAVYARWAYFHTTSFQSRIYTYERDVLHSFSIPALFDQGHRSYVLLKYQPARSWAFWVRWAQSHYPGREAVGSGSDLIRGSTRSEIKVQCRWQW